MYACAGVLLAFPFLHCFLFFPSSLPHRSLIFVDLFACVLCLFIVEPFSVPHRFLPLLMLPPRLWPPIVVVSVLASGRPVCWKWVKVRIVRSLFLVFFPMVSWILIILLSLVRLHRFVFRSVFVAICCWFLLPCLATVSSPWCVFGCPVFFISHYLVACCHRLCFLLLGRPLSSSRTSAPASLFSGR